MIGRPTQYFRLPSNVELARILGVPLSSITDVLSLEDLKSAKSTRQALHYGYIQRRPGKYATKWLAKRLSVSKVTKNRYDKALKDLHKLATYSQKTIYWNNLNDISDKYDVLGQFLEDDTGKRYPAKRVIAVKLLKQKRKIKLLTRGFNYYWVGHKFDVDPQALLTVSQNKKLPEPDFTGYWRGSQNQPAAQVSGKPIEYINAATPGIMSPQSGKAGNEILRSDKSSPGSSGAGEQKPVVDEATLEIEASVVQAFINRMITVPEYRLSLQNARQLLRDYGLATVKQAMNRVSERQHVRNPAGLLITILRGEARLKELQHISRSG